VLSSHAKSLKTLLRKVEWFTDCVYSLLYIVESDGDTSLFSRIFMFFLLNLVLSRTFLRYRTFPLWKSHDGKYRS